MTAKAPEAEDEELAVREGPMSLLEFIYRSLAQSDQRALGDPCVAFGHLERSAPAVDQLARERKPPLVDLPPNSIECQIIGMASHRGGEKLGKFRRIRRHCKARCVEQSLEQLGPAG